MVIRACSMHNLSMSVQNILGPSRNSSYSFLVLILLVLLQSCASDSPSRSSKKDPVITAAEQLTFVLCKKQSGDYRSQHTADMNQVLEFHKINPATLKAKPVTDLARANMDNGSCEFYEGVDRVFDLAKGVSDAAPGYGKLRGWQRALVGILAEAECRTREGKLDNAGREQFVVSAIEGDQQFSAVSEDEFASFIKTNTAQIVWLGHEKIKNGSCSYLPKPS